MLTTKCELEYKPKRDMCIYHIGAKLNGCNITTTKNGTNVTKKICIKKEDCQECDIGGNKT